MDDPCWRRCGVVRFVLLALQPGDAVALGLEAIEQHLLVLEPLIEQQLIEAAGDRQLLAEQLLGLQLLPSGPDHRTSGEQGELAGGDPAVVGFRQSHLGMSYREPRQSPDD